MRQEADKSPLKIGAILNAPNTLIEGGMFTFTEKKNTEDGSRLKIINTETGEVTYTTDAAIRANYALNGINNTSQDIDKSYFINKDGTKSIFLIERENPTHGLLGDLVESTLGKIADWTGQEHLIAMNRIGAQDDYDRRNILDAINLYHSQGTIIGKGAMELYSKTFQVGVDLNNRPLTDNNNNPIGAQRINETQRFVAVGPAVLREDWNNAVKALGGNELKDNADWQHDPLDPVRYLTAPTNILGENSKVYIPNLLEIPAGLWNLQNMNKHSVTNDMYKKFIDPTVEKNQ